MGLDGGTISESACCSGSRVLEAVRCGLLLLLAAARHNHRLTPTRTPCAHAPVSRNDVLRGQCWDLAKSDDSRSTRGGAVRGAGVKRRKLDAQTSKCAARPIAPQTCSSSTAAAAALGVALRAAAADGRRGPPPRPRTLCTLPLPSTGPRDGRPAR